MLYFILISPSFGYRDGISNPGVDGVDTLNPGQTTIDQGIALLGRGQDASAGRAPWALDGSFMAFRKLPQLVPEFDKYVSGDKSKIDNSLMLG